MKPKFTVKGHGGIVAKSWRDVGRLGYGSGGAADSPWARQGIHVLGAGQAGTGGQLTSSTGGPGLPLSRRDRLENPNLKKAHDYIEGPNGCCIFCVMQKVGHDKLMEKLACS